MLASPMAPWKGAPLRVVFAAEKPLDGELSLIAPNGNIAAASGVRHGGPPYFWFAEVASPAPGTWQAMLVRNNASADCKTVTREIVVQRKPGAGPRAGKGVWPAKNDWNRETENLYSAWIETLFEAPLEEAPSWKAMHEVLRDPSRNVLFNHLGLREDQKGLVIQPDCADVPYFLRAYFAFKMGLPFGYAKCTRGDGGQAPRCTQWWNIVNEEPPPAPPPDAVCPAPSDCSACSGRRQLPPQPVLKLPPQAARARAGVRILSADDHRQRRALRQRANRGGRRRHRLLSRAAHRGCFASRHHLRRPLRARSRPR